MGGCSPGSRGEPRAKGVWFVSARRCLVEGYGGEPTVERVARRMGEARGQALREPLASGERPDVTVRDYTEDRMSVEVFFRNRVLRA